MGENMDRRKNDYYFNMFLNILRSTYLNVEKDWNNVANEVGLGYAQQHALWILHVKDGLTLKEIGNIAMWNKSTTSSLISKLEKKKLVKKMSSGEGTREIKIFITEKGRGLLDESVNTPISREFMELFKDYDEEELKDFLEKLKMVCSLVNKDGYGDFMKYLDEYSQSLLK